MGRVGMETGSDVSGTEDERVLFDAVLRPHRSMGPRGFRILLIGAGIASTAMGLAFYLIGAWPIIGFLGLDILLLYIAFKINFRRARAVETVRLTPSALEIARVAPGGRRRAVRLRPYWLRVDHSADADGRSPLRILGDGRGVTIGAFLPPEQRLTLATELRAALHRLKNPTFG